MYLKSLEIQGFKSFPDKVKLVFNQGMTSVIGPNGSGKSNISDAVRWVLGEQSTKNLRSSKMDEVIFSGTKLRRPQGFAQVTLVLDNRERRLDIDADEVSICRKLYRSGESEYKINQNNVRLKDINELLMDTGLGADGYSLISQGKAAEIVTAKPNQRREIFEEAAGISKYRYRKNQALGRLALAEENLLRLKDIFTELEERVGPLERQAKKARQYLALAEEKRRLEVSLWVHSLYKAKDLLREQENKILICENDRAQVEARLQALEEESNAYYAQMQQFAIKADECRRQKASVEESLAQASSNAAVWQNDIGHNTQLIARLGQTFEEDKAESARINGQIAQTNERIAALQESEQALVGQELALQEDFGRVSMENDGFTQHSQQLAEQIQQMNKRMMEQTSQQVSNETMLKEANRQQEALQAQLAARRELLDERKRERREYRDMLEELEERLGSLQNAMQGYIQKQDKRQQKFHQEQQHYQALQKELLEQEHRMNALKELENSMEGFAYSVKYVCEQARRGILKGVYGPVSGILKLEGRFSVAIETALGGALQNIVVENESVAKASINLLKRDNKGRATFLPLSSIKPYSFGEKGLEQMEGFVGMADKLVEFDPKFQNIISSLLARVVVAETLDDATRIAKQYGYRFRIVTLDGQIINAGGSFTGGSMGKNIGVLSRRSQIEGLEKQTAHLSGQLAALRQKVDEQLCELKQIEAEKDGIDSEMRTLLQDKARFESEYKRVDLSYKEHLALLEEDEEALERTQKRMQQMQAQNVQIKEALSALEQQMLSLEEGSQQALKRQETLRAQRDALYERLNALKLKRQELSKDRQQHEQTLLMLNEQLFTQQNKAENAQQEIEQLKAKNQQIEEQIQGLNAQKQAWNEELAQLESDILQAQQARQSLENQVQQTRAGEREALTQKENIASEYARLSERRANMEQEYDKLVSKLYDEYELTRTQAESQAQKIEDEPAANRQLNEVKAKIKSLGSVNVDAIEEYKEVSERYDFMKAQIADVESSKAEIARLIGDLTGKMRTMFSQSFEEINRHFSRIFKELFGGGSARLELTEADDILDAGIEIFVEPPGKIIKNLAALSGGEQAFVAITLYFAILNVRPSPFCILDEVEAALDDVNVSRFASYLRKLNDKTQFIMITHRRGTMEESDVLYGVTMQEEGVSKLLELDISEIESRLGMKETT